MSKSEQMMMMVDLVGAFVIVLVTLMALVSERYRAIMAWVTRGRDGDRIELAVFANRMADDDGLPR